MRWQIFFTGQVDRHFCAKLFQPFGREKQRERKRERGSKSSSSNLSSVTNINTVTVSTYFDTFIADHTNTRTHTNTPFELVQWLAGDRLLNVNILIYILWVIVPLRLFASLPIYSHHDTILFSFGKRVDERFIKHNGNNK